MPFNTFFSTYSRSAIRRSVEGSVSGHFSAGRIEWQRQAAPVSHPRAYATVMSAERCRCFLTTSVNIVDGFDKATWHADALLLPNAKASKWIEANALQVPRTLKFYCIAVQIRSQGREQSAEHSAVASLQHAPATLDSTMCKFLKRHQRVFQPF